MHSGAIEKDKNSAQQRENNVQISIEKIKKFICHLSLILRSDIMWSDKSAHNAL